MRYRVDTLLCVASSLEDFLNQMADEEWNLVTILHRGVTGQTERVGSFSATGVPVEAFVVVHQRPRKPWWKR